MSDSQYSFYTAKVISIREQNAQANTYTVIFDDSVIINHGQFIMISAPENGEIIAMANPIAQNGQICEFTIDLSNRFSLDFITKIRINSEITIRGGFGRPFDTSELKLSDTTLISHGLQFADLRPHIALLLANKSGRLDLLLSAYDQSELLFTDEYSHWQALDNTQLTISLEHPDSNWSGHRGDILSLVAQNNHILDGRTIIMALPERYLNKTLEYIMTNKIDMRNIYLLIKNGIKCGIGKCGGCHIGPYKVCTDGPTMLYNDIAKFMTMRKYDHRLTGVNG